MFPSFKLEYVEKTESGIEKERFTLTVKRLTKKAAENLFASAEKLIKSVAK